MRAFMLLASALITLTLATACGGGGSTPPVSSPGSPSGGGPPPTLPSSVTASSGALIGSDNVFTPNDGDTSTGGNGQMVDGIPCLPTMAEAHYHVHVFLGIVFNGSMAGVPDGVGMKNPADDVSGVTNKATCFYYLHTHDVAGIVHVEDPSTASRTTALHTLGQFLDIWGQQLSSSGFGPFAGPVRIYTSGQHYVGQGSQSVASSSYSQYGGDPHSMPLYAHEVIWIEIGPTFIAPQSLPQVHFTY